LDLGIHQIGSHSAAVRFICGPLCGHSGMEPELHGVHFAAAN